MAIKVSVNNAAEDAFEAAFFMTLPRGVGYAKMKRLEDSSSDVTVYCSQSSRGPHGNATLKCDLGNPLPSDSNVSAFLCVNVGISCMSFRHYINFLADKYLTQINPILFGHSSTLAKGEGSIQIRRSY